MTIRELVSHTGGLTYGFFSRSQVDTLYQQANILDRNSTLGEMVGKLANIPLRQQPGTQWHYSVGVDVQGHLLEVLAGKPLDQVLRERVFEPLGMNDTGFWVHERTGPVSRRCTVKVAAANCARCLSASIGPNQSCSRVAEDWCPPPWTICASARCC